MKNLMLGNEAIARGAFEAGVRVVSSYPGTPSTEITEYLATYDEIYSEWAPNEKVALEVAIGASIAGARSLAAMKHVGLNVAADPLFTASYTGVNGGLVICVADDQGLHSSQNEQDSRHYANASKVLMLEPADSMECIDYVKKAFDLSEKFDTPVLIRLSTRISHSQSLVETKERVDVPLKDYKKDPMKYVMMPAMARGRHVIVEERIKSLIEFAETTELNKIEYNDKKIGIISAGIAYQYAKDALGTQASYLKLGVVYPLPVKLIVDFVNSVDVCYVIEELDPIIEKHIRALGVNIIGKEKFSLLGEYTPDMIRGVVCGINESSSFVVSEDIPNRPPVMCAACPHRGVFHVLKKLNLNVSGDIGCYTLGALSPLKAIHTCVCMGASIGVAHGMACARGREFDSKNVAVIGDSTFMHSGVTGLIDIVYNKGTSTTLILDNSTTGMTGHQQNPSTGFTIKNEPTAIIDIKKLCEGIGVKRVFVVDPFDIDNFTKVLKEELEMPEPSVIITRRPCALLKGVKYSGTTKVDSEKCISCMLCFKIGCPAIIKVDNKAYIEPTQCSACGFCVNVCKSSAIVKD